MLKYPNQHLPDVYFIPSDNAEFLPDGIENSDSQTLKNALINKDGLGTYNIKIDDETLMTVAKLSNGDVRTALNGLEVAVLTTTMDSDDVFVFFFCQ